MGYLYSPAVNNSDKSHKFARSSIANVFCISLTSLHLFPLELASSGQVTELSPSNQKPKDGRAPADREIC